MSVLSGNKPFLLLTLGYLILLPPLVFQVILLLGLFGVLRPLVILHSGWQFDFEGLSRDLLLGLPGLALLLGLLRSRNRREEFRKGLRLTVPAALLFATFSVELMASGSRAEELLKNLYFPSPEINVPALPADGDAGSAYDDARIMARRDALEIMSAFRAPGLSVAVVVEGAPVWVEAFGFSNLERQIEARPETKFRFNSVSKTLTAAAAALLWEQGRLDLDASVQTYVPSFPDKGHLVTTRQLGGHLAGIRHYNSSAEVRNLRYYSSAAETLAAFENDPLLFTPGTRFSYSSYGWNLIGAVIEGASGENFMDFLREHVLEPAGLEHTAADGADSLHPGRVRYYEATPGGNLVALPDWNLTNRLPAGGIISTAGDIARFGAALLHGKILRPETVDFLFTSQYTSSGEKTGYGFGWEVSPEPDRWKKVTITAGGLTGYKLPLRLFGRRIAYHRGGSPGSLSFLAVYPDQDVVMALAANCASPARGTIIPDPRVIAERFIQARQRLRQSKP